MSQMEDIFMAGFFGELDGEEKVAEEMPVLGKALANLGLLEEEEEMPILKKAMENLGLLDETEEPSTMLEALAQAYGSEVAAEREAMEKDAKVSEAIKGLLSRYTGGMREFGSGAKRLASSLRPKKGKPGKRTPRPKGAALAKMRAKARKQLKKGAPAAAGTLATGAGGVGLAALLGRKKKKGKK